MQTLDWYDREEIFEDGIATATTMELEADGIIRFSQFKERFARRLKRTVGL
ncbi:MAG: hypothetical protein ACI9DK_001695 [Vicingaceae bacterium]